jgi:hypothetical protein
MNIATALSRFILRTMVRPSGSPANRMIALEFAKLVTRQTGDDEDLVACCGRCSLFSTLQETFPNMARDNSGSERDGLSEVEYNKLLQVYLTDRLNTIEIVVIQMLS